MANERYTRTNQKIYFAGLALESLGRAEQGGSMNAQGLLQAEREAVLFHLYGAALGLCHEVAGYYRLDDSSIPRVEDYLQIRRADGLAIPELAEMAEMRLAPDSWVSELLRAYSALFLPPVAPAVVKGDVTQPPLIQAVNIDAPQSPELTREILEGWRQSIKQLVVRFRAGMSEC